MSLFYIFKKYYLNKGIVLFLDLKRHNTLARGSNVSSISQFLDSATTLSPVAEHPTIAV
jgi:hypothetical protein